MLSEAQASAALVKAYPERTPTKNVLYKGLYAFVAPSSDPMEGNMDPFFTVNAQTGEVKEFSILMPGFGREVAKLLAKA